MVQLKSQEMKIYFLRKKKAKKMKEKKKTPEKNGKQSKK